jgi:hypothetical protein
MTTELLAIIGPEDADRELVEEIARRQPHRVTVLIDGGDPEWAADESDAGAALRDRLATLLYMIERRTGATVVGLAGDREQLDGWRFDRVVSTHLPLAA